MTQALLLTTLIIAAILMLLGGQVARRRGLREQTGISIALALVTIGALLAPSHWREQILEGDSGEQILVFAREIGLTGLFFLAGNRLKLGALRAGRRVSVAVAASGLVLFAAIAVLVVILTGSDWSQAIVIGASVAASSIWLPSHLSSEANEKQSGVSSAGVVAALILSGALMLVIHLLGAFHEVAGRASSTSAYVIVAAYELAKVTLFFSFAWFIATRFLDRAAKASTRLWYVRAALGYLLIVVLVFVLGRTALGELGALAWSFMAGALFTRSEVGKRVASYRPAAAAMFLSVVFLPMFLQAHGRTVTRLPLLLGVIIAAFIVKFAASALAARLGGYAARDVRVMAVSTLASGEMAVALLAFGLTRWVIDGPEYFAVLFFALLSMIASPIVWSAATRSQRDQTERANGDSANQTKKAQQGQKAGHNTHRKAGFAIAMVATALLSIDGTASAQTASPPAQDDPVSRAMRTVEESVNHRAAAAEQLLAASKLVNQSKAARQQGKRDLAREAVTKAESIAADSEFNRSALIDELLRLVAEEKAALDSPIRREVEQFPAGRSLAVPVPGSVRPRLEQYRESFARILEEEGVPVGLLGVALVESGFNPLALSPKGARGIWQFMPATAVRYGLTVQPGNDHRTHPEHSTRAAARYLRFLFNQFGDWKLALAGYNAGEARVQRIIDRTGIRDFDEMSRRGLLPLETRKYVPAVLAVFSRLGGTNLITTAKARQKNKTRGGVVEALVKLEGSPAPPEAQSRQ
ncbi:MAG TPA: transglycosylase SLT domain-containing protein [Blastocatellia bacterium]|nr:transglycosylase SLT domain-containing protein [Blastocatellia bacterium]